MIFSKRHFVAACLLLGTSGFLVSCNETKHSPKVATSTGCVPTADCTDENLGVSSEICPESDESKGPTTPEVPDAGCVDPNLVSQN